MTRNLILIIVSFCLLILMPPDKVYAQQDDSFLDIQEVVSKGGIKAWLVEDHNIPVLAMEFIFRGQGAITDLPEKQGLARMVSNTLDEGAGDIKSREFQKELQDLSLTLRFNVSRDHFGGSFKTLSRNRARGFELLKLALTQPRFDKEPVDRMRDANKSRLRSSINDPRWIGARIQNDRIFEDHPYAQNSGGTLSSLDRITPAELKAFHKKLTKSDLVISVAGDITAEELSIALDEIFGSLPESTDEKNKATNKITLQNSKKTYLFERDIPQTHIEIAQNGIGRSDDNYHAAQVMNFILGGGGFGSRLMDEIREKRGLTYGIYTYFREYNESDVYHLTTSTQNSSVKELLDLVKAEWIKIKNEPVSQKELSDARSYLLGSLPLSLTSTDSIAGLLLTLQIDKLPIDYLDKRQETIRGITTNDIQRVAERILDSNSFTTILVGKPENVENAEIITLLPNVE
ncbi:MAG: insulinase family protein [Alphaproteobacteria bacterium]|nr:insulinase family protein [Alphaproteobacteria bacterium]